MLLCAPLLAAGQHYPDRPVRLIVPFPPGGNVDAFARVLARQVEIQLSQSIVVDNRGGANGIVGGGPLIAVGASIACRNRGDG